MINKFSEQSLKRLETCDPRLQILMTQVLEIIDITILDGYRDEVKQNNFYHAGKSQVKYPNSKHNKQPSQAVDIAIYHKKEPHIEWENVKEWFYLAGIVKGVSSKLGIPIRWGGDFNNDKNFSNDGFVDYPHFEIMI